MTRSNVVRGALALFACWFDGVPALLAAFGGELFGLALFVPALGGLIAAMFVRQTAVRRLLTAGACLVFAEAAALVLKVSFC